MCVFPAPGSPAPPPMVWSPKNPSLPAACHVSICLVCLYTSWKPNQQLTATPHHRGEGGKVAPQHQTTGGGGIGRCY